MLNLDNSLFFVALLVWLLMIVLNRIFFKPVGQVIMQRESKIENESNRIESMTREIEEKTQQIEKKLDDAQKKFAAIKEELIKKGEEARKQHLIETRIESQKLFETKMNELDVQVAAAEEKITRGIGILIAKLNESFTS
ncbi:MAG: ATP synthase F0 subunit B [Candidatus Aminicenantes bacterium]|nr:ATP synthase F0 subunit B [Candidatus Aminicenantes bacterium]